MILFGPQNRVKFDSYLSGFELSGRDLVGLWHVGFITPSPMNLLLYKKAFTTTTMKNMDKSHLLQACIEGRETWLM
jgi:hypothetical protein